MSCILQYTFSLSPQDNPEGYVIFIVLHFTEKEFES